MVLKRNKKDRNILFIDASNEFKKDKNKNVLTEENINKIYSAYLDRKNIDKYTSLATREEIENNDYNLNIPRYVDTSEPEEEIDLQEVLNQIRKDDEEILELEKKIEEQLKLLGVIKNDDDSQHAE